MTPGSTRIQPFARSTSRIRRIRESEMTTEPSTGRAPPERPVPAPRGTIGIPASRATPTTPTTSSVDAGSTTITGRVRPCVRPSAS